MTDLCKPNQSIRDCELSILRKAMDYIEKKEKRRLLISDEIKDMLSIVEEFIQKRELVCYGGTAINNILPKEDQFYDNNIELPDYDFFSKNALKDAKDLADIYYKKGFKNVQAKAGVHVGTYKVFVNFVGIADITQMDTKLFNNLKKSAKKVNKILYAPPNYLRMAMYLELSRPRGNISRWEKVLKRLILLNKNYPLVGKNCDKIKLKNEFETTFKKMSKKEKHTMYDVVKESFIDQGLVFFGGLANQLYTNYQKKRKNVVKIPDFDVLSEDPETSAIIVKERLLDEGFSGVTIRSKEGIGEIIAPHYEILVQSESVAFIYEPLACHSYNVTTYDGHKIKIATIDTILSFFLAFIYADRPYYDVNRILCMAQYLFDLQEKNRLSQKGILRRYNLKCFGTQLTLQDSFIERGMKYKLLRNDKNTKEYEKWFLKYNPEDKFEPEKSNKRMKNTKQTRKGNLKRLLKNKTRKYKPLKTHSRFFY